MRFWPQLLFALSTVGAKTIESLSTTKDSQHILENPASERVSSSNARPTRHTPHFDAAPNSVGLLLTSAGEKKVMHVWLPLGKRLETRDSPTLPAHPLSARITTLIHSSPELATPERLNEVEYIVHLHVNETSAADSRWEARFGRRKRPKKQAMEKVLFRRDDGLVRLAGAGSKFWLDGAEVEAYECR